MPPFCTEAVGYSVLQETAPKPPSQGWRKLLPTWGSSSPASLVGWQSRVGVEDTCWGLWGGPAPRMGAGWQLNGSRDFHEHGLPASTAILAKPGLKSWGVSSFSRNIMK